MLIIFAIIYYNYVFKCKSLLKPVKKCLMQLSPTPGDDTAHSQVYTIYLFIYLFIFCYRLLLRLVIILAPV